MLCQFHVKNYLLILFYYYRVIQIVINREDVQGYAAKTVFEALQAPACHENMVKVSIIIVDKKKTRENTRIYFNFTNFFIIIAELKMNIGR